MGHSDFIPGSIGRFRKCAQVNYSMSMTKIIQYENEKEDEKKLLPYQTDVVERSLKFLSTDRAVYNGCEQGTGKSIMTAATYNKLCELHKKNLSLLVIAPASMLLTWRDELTSWSLLTPYVITSGDELSYAAAASRRHVIVSYKLACKPEFTKMLCKKEFDLLVIDEAHYLLSLKSIRTKVITKLIWESVHYKICLSGTPFSSCLTDCFPVFSKILPQVFDNYYAFANRYCEQRKTDFGIKYYGAKNQPELRRIIRSRFFIRYRKDEVLKDLPSKTWSKITLPKEYDVQLIHSDEEKIRSAIWKQLTAVNRGETREPPTHLAHYRRMQGQVKIPAVVEFTENLLSQNIPIVLFAYHRDVIESYRLAFKKYNPSLLQGGMSAEAKQEAKNRFQEGKTLLFIGQITAAGTGITLHAAATCIYGELDWSPSVLAQSSDRLHRIGQRKNVTCYYFIVEGSLDQDLMNTCIRKAKDFRSVLDENN